MKKLAFVFALLFSLFNPLKASHFAGGDLQYVFIGDSTGVAHQYLFILRLYRDVSGIQMPTDVDLNICSSCFPSQSINMPQYGPAMLAPTLFDCVDQNAPGTVTMEVYEYRKVANLPGACQDFEFKTESLNARNGAIDNLTLASANSNLVIEASLNNYSGNNSSPKFVSEPVRAFCVGQQFNWKQSAIDKDGDSLFFRLIEPKGGPFNQVCSSVPFTFMNGWSYSQPIRTVAGTSLNINNKTGLITFTPGFQEVDVLAIGVQEFRYDSVYNQWIEIGESTRDMQITVSPNCTPQAQMGVVLDYTASGTYVDPISGLPTIDYTCLDSSVIMNFQTKLDCSTISADGTDFRLTSPTGQPIPIKEIVSICDANFETDQLLVKLHKPLAANGKYFLYSKIGNDGNTLLNKCGFPMSEFDTIQLKVEGCFVLKMDIKNVYINEDLFPVVEWDLDKTSYPNYLFDKMLVYRKDPGASFIQIGQQVNQNKNFYFDQQVDASLVDINTYDYKIEVLLNNTQMGKSRGITSILLEASGNNCDSLELTWTKYDGWANPLYTVYLGIEDGMGGHTWVPQNTTPIADNTYIFKLDPTQEVGNYKLKVESVDPTSTYTAISNWTTCGKNSPPVSEPTDPVVPNVFTPNNDGQNDLLTLSSLHTWNGKKQVVIRNRWGETVYKTDSYNNAIAFDGTNRKGADLADGIYFIAINLYDTDSGKTFEYNGTVTIIRNK
jgi:gliding motility-associated-like protein